MLYSLIGLVTALVIGGSGYEVHRASACYTDIILTLSCPDSFLIRVFNVTYGLSESQQCHFTQGECSLTEPTSLRCNGKTNCTIVITEQTKYYSTLPICLKTGNYMEAVYECVPVSALSDLCTARVSEPGVTSGYVATPFYSSGTYFDNLNCQYQIIGSDIKLQIITLNLTDSGDCLSIHNQFNAKTYCGGSAVMENFDVEFVQNGQLTLSFTSGSAGHTGGLWLYYTVIPRPITLSTPTTKVTTSRSTARVTRTTEMFTRVTSPELHDERSVLTSTPQASAGEKGIFIVNNVNSQLTTGTLATTLGLIIGLLGCAVLILLVIYFIRRYKDKQRKRSSLHNGAVIWHNMSSDCTSSDCVSNIINKREQPAEHAYCNNIVNKENNTGYKPVQHSFC